MNALVIGSTGLVGSYLVQGLANNPSIEKVWVMTRRSGFLQGGGYNNDKLEEVIVDFDQLDLGTIKPDVVFCALGTTIKKAGSKDRFYQIDHDYVIDAARKSFEVGAQQFLYVSSIGANADSMTFYLRVKGEVEKDLEQIGFNRLSVFRPSLLLGPRQERRTGEKFGEFMLKLFKPLMVGGLRSQRPVHASQVANCMISHIDQGGPYNLVTSNEIRTHKITE